MQTNCSPQGCHQFFKIRFFCNTATPMQCFYTTTADMSSYDRDHMTHKPKIFTFGPLRTSLLTPLYDGLTYIVSIWQAGWSGEASPGGLISVLYGLSFSRSLEFFIWWCQDSPKWQETASPKRQAFLKSLLASQFSVVCLVKVSPWPSPESVGWTTQETVVKKRITEASLESNPPRQPVLPQSAFPSLPSPVPRIEHMVDTQYMLGEVD